MIRGVTAKKKTPRGTTREHKHEGACAHKRQKQKIHFNEDPKKEKKTCKK